MIQKFFARLFKFLIYAIILGILGLCWFAWHTSGPILQPYSQLEQTTNQKAGMKLDYFQIKGNDGIMVNACIASSLGETSRSPKQSRVFDIVKSRAKLKSVDVHNGVVLICTSWDHGIENSLSYAEALTSVGYTCLLWDPRGVDNAREYCSYGYFEAADVPILLNHVDKLLGGVDSFSGVGHGFGASLLSMAAAKDSRIRSLISIDSFCSLKTVIAQDMKKEVGKALDFPAFWLVDWGLSSRAGFSSFDVAPVDSVRSLNIPMMFACSEEYFFSPLDDVLSLYSALPSERKAIYTRRRDGEQGISREYIRVLQGKKGDKFEKKFTLSLYDGDDELMACIAEWIEDNTQQPLPKLLPDRPEVQKEAVR
ncbi:MAG: hypothetical protein RSE01_06030 [Akkermansia sp.]